MRKGEVVQRRISVFLGIFLFLAALPCLASRADNLSDEMKRALEQRFKENLIDQTQLLSSAEKIFKTFEWAEVRLPLIDYPRLAGTPVLMRGYTDIKAINAKPPSPSVQFSCVVDNEEYFFHFRQLLESKQGFIALIARDLWLGNRFRGPAADLVIRYHFPSDKIVSIGKSKYSFTKELQKYVVIKEQSDYEADTWVLLIEEPHYDPGAQFNLYKGLSVFFSSYPQLVKKTIFLVEGIPRDQEVSVEPLLKVDPQPSDTLIRKVLESFLITGQIAYKWKTSQNIPIVGTEDPHLYNLSAQLWVESLKADEQSTIDRWNNSVAIRNQDMLESLIKAIGSYENPMLFIGGLHLDLGLRDQLRQKKIGYAFTVPVPGILYSSEEEERYIFRYRDLFEAQRFGNYNEYIRAILGSGGVTVRSNTAMAAVFAAAAKGGEKGQGKDRNKNGGDGFLSKLNDLWDRVKAKFNQNFFKISKHIEDSMKQRGWSKEQIADTIKNAIRRIRNNEITGERLKDTRNLPDGSKMNDPATAYVRKDGNYVVRNDRTGDIVQVSDTNNPSWKPPWLEGAP